ncbi:MAG: dephospho-CoA kinase [Bacillota bacterium]
MFAGKPIIGIAGGIGSGKSHVARLFGEFGALVIDSDQQVSEVYHRQDVKQTLRSWWKDSVFDAQGNIDKRAVARRIFQDTQERQRLEGLVHPLIAQSRDRLMAQAADDPRIVAYVWDAPLLIEVGLHRQCDAVVFVESDDEQRYRRVHQTRGWTREEWQRREKSQLPLDKKRIIAKYIVRNTADTDEEVRDQVREVLSRILAEVRR